MSTAARKARKRERLDYRLAAKLAHRDGYTSLGEQMTERAEALRVTKPSKRPEPGPVEARRGWANMSAAEILQDIRNWRERARTAPLYPTPADYFDYYPLKRP